MIREEVVESASALETQLVVGPCEGRSTRRVEARYGEKRVVDKFDIDRMDRRRRFTECAAKELGLSDDQQAEIEREIVAMAEEVDAQAMVFETEDLNDEACPEMSGQILEQTDPELIAKAEQFLASDDLIEQLHRDFETLGIVGEQTLAMSIYLTATSRFLDKPLGAVVQAASSAGKSYVTDTVVSMMPPEDVVKATDFTANALYYMKKCALKHKLVCVAERKHADRNDDAAAANDTLSFREMMSSGALTKLVTMKTEKGYETKKIVQEGPIAYIETTTQGNIFDEDATRMLSLVADESEQQTQRIMQQLARNATGEGSSGEDREFVRQKHQAAQRLLGQHGVRIPFAGHLSIPTMKIAARRAFGQLLACIQAVTLLRQRHKVDDKHDSDRATIDASVEDYEIAYNVMQPILRRVFTPIPEKSKNLYEQLKQRFPARAIFRRKDCAELLGVEPASGTVRHRLDPLVHAGLVELLDNSPRGQYQYRVKEVAVPEDEERDDAVSAAEARLEGLITPQELRQLLDSERAE